MTSPEQCAELLQQMVQIESINEHHSGTQHPEAELAQYLKTVCQAWELDAELHPVDDLGDFNLIVQHVVDPDAPWLLFESHMDTVGVEGMTIDPFSGLIKDGKLWGRGSCDTKGSGAAMLCALRRYAHTRGGSTGRARTNNVAIVFTVDEESLQAGVTSFVRNQLPRFRRPPSGVIVGEPTKLRPVVAHCGVARFSVRTNGVAAHSSDPSRGRSAIKMMMTVMESLESRYIAALDAEHPLTGKAQCSINVIHGGSAVNIVPDTCEIKIDRRVVPGEDPESVVPTVQRLLDELQDQTPGLSCSITDVRTNIPLDPTGGESFIKEVQSVLRSGGMADELRGAGHGSDGSAFRKAGLPVALIGPGDIALAHSEAECIELDQLEQAIEVYLDLMHAQFPEQS